ncbi:hypothetical protein CCHR01_11416 [Colletotrichum chrysophilum]|uniref:Clr5 domain-containing protein n=1 Tax=Colletotrichum chrysophilum TaxID=1836956 RepID=A0AAD9EFS3_9PEZI|nr:hypothetical protein CCHR01_11416 [Colletotrichum chrysophilum]
MSKDHSFFATMYKRQFQRWNWRKYNTRGLQKCEMDGQVVERSHGQMTCRRPHKGHRNPQISKSPRNKEACVHNYARSPISTNSILPEGLRYISGNDRSTQILLKSLHDLIQGASCDEGSVWNGENIKFTGLLTAGAGVLSQLNLAIRLFTSQDFQQGGAILRKAFRSLESVVDREAIEIHQVLLLHIPYYLPSAYRDILHTYLGHLRHILEAKQKQHPIAKIAREMEAISSESSDLLMDVMERMFSTTAHNYNQLRGLDDLASIQATLESFLSTKRTPTKSESSHLLKRFEDFLESSTAMFGETSERVIEIESRQISAAARMEALSIAEGFMELCERHLARICAANRFSRLERWDRWSLSRYSETKDRMFDAFAHEGDIDRGMSCLKESMKALSLANEIAESEEDVASYASTLWHHRIFLVDVLEALGRAAEAEEVRKSVAAPSQRSAYLFCIRTASISCKWADTKDSKEIAIPN